MRATMFPLRSLSLRLALQFALAGAVLTGAMGLYLYQSLARELAGRDDQALAGRVERMGALIDDSASIDALQRRPQLYGNMMGNRDSMLWIVDDQGAARISINPAHLPVPRLPGRAEIEFGDLPGPTPARLAWRRLEHRGAGLTLVAGKLLAERDQMMASYRDKVLLALAASALLMFALGWQVSRHGLAPVRRLAARAAAIDSAHLHLRLAGRDDVTELAELSAALDTMLARLEHGFAQLSRFSEDLAHELRTPLNNLMGHTQQTLSRGRSIEQYQELLASNQEEYERLARMIDSMLFLARNEHADALVRRGQVDLAPLVDQLCEYFEGMAEERGMRFDNRVQGSVAADPDLLRRALANLLANALRYGTPGSTIGVASAVVDGMVEVSVHNIGPQIGAAHLPHLFERFYRADAARSGHGDTGGLGLAIVASIMQLHGGSARVESGVDGSCFTLRFPNPTT
ncbi:heavy metal sensor histidine kinase [Massilia violaceinigra]|uniref:Sensor protein n=1 Tax=Massilia violaceinigra TaxID=2045208 RepID=A0ABY4A452_9BURK|nr:heavy metal sensor histidine kinase [Massilia violaceinigra]UOD29554.1 heavy metal sensor histidine kinase [Massilia violaceinigra]